MCIFCLKKSEISHIFQRDPNENGSEREKWMNSKQTTPPMIFHILNPNALTDEIASFLEVEDIMDESLFAGRAQFAGRGFHI